MPWLKALSLTSDTAIPLAPPVIAVLNAFTISLMLLSREPVHWYSQPRSLQASSAP